MASWAGGLVVGVVGASGAVGAEMVSCLSTRRFPVRELRLFASERSAGKTMSTPFGDLQLEAFSVQACRECQIVFLAVSGDFALQYAREICTGSGPVVIDNSSAFRYDPEIPLVVPEINARVLLSGSKLIANPNCTTAIAAVALWPLHQAFTLRKIIMSTYQAASGAGAEGMAELTEGTAAQLAGLRPSHSVFVHPLPFNLIPHIDKFQANGYTKEEMKVVWETRKIFGVDEEVRVSCTAVRIPTLRAHAEAITIETVRAVSPQEARRILSQAPGVKVVDDPANSIYPMPLTASSAHDVEVGRLRQSLIFGDRGLDLFVCGDQLLRGAALNAVLIAEKLLALDALR